MINGLWYIKYNSVATYTAATGDSRQSQWEVYQHEPNLVPHPVVRREQCASIQIQGEQRRFCVSSSYVHWNRLESWDEITKLTHSIFFFKNYNENQIKRTDQIKSLYRTIKHLIIIIEGIVFWRATVQTQLSSAEISMLLNIELSQTTWNNSVSTSLVRQQHTRKERCCACECPAYTRTVECGVKHSNFTNDDVGLFLSAFVLIQFRFVVQFLFSLELLSGY